jgi:hypothetical protein
MQDRYRLLKDGRGEPEKLIIVDQVLMGEGTWNNLFYSKDEIKKAFEGTDWSSREKKNLFLDHKDKDASEWLGDVSDMYFSGDTLMGTLNIYDPGWINKMYNGKPKFGISPKVVGEIDQKNKKMKNFLFDNFSLVVNPAVKMAYINNNKEVLRMEDKLEAILEAPVEPTPEEIAKKKKYPIPEEASDRDQLILDAAAEIMAKKKLPPEQYPMPAAKCSETADEVMAALEAFELQGNTAAVTKKAKAIRKPGESWSAAIKRAAMEMEQEDKNMEDKKALEEIEAKMKQQIETMSAKIKELTDKLNEPAVKTLVKATDQAEMDPDLGMVQFLSKMEAESYERA